MATQGSDNKTIIIDFKVLPNDAVKTIQDTKAKIDNLKETMAGMKAAGLDNTETYIKLEAAMKDMQQVVRANQKVLLDSIKEQKAEGDSLNALRAQLRGLREEYENLSKAERESAAGNDLLNKINDVTDEVKGLEFNLQDFTRNVGNYWSALEGFPGGKLLLMFKSVGAGTMSLSQAFKLAGQSAMAFAKQLLALIATPIGAAIAAISVAVMGLVNAFKKNDAAMTELQRAFAAFKPILDVINKGFQALVGVVTKAVTAIGNGVRAIMSWIPGLKEYAEAQDDIVVATDNLEEAERQYALNSAKRQAEISELKAKTAETDKYTFEERKGFLQQALDLEEEELKESKAVAEEKLRIAEKNAALEMGYYEMTDEVYEMMSDEMKNSINELRVAVVNAEKEFSDGTRKIRSQMSKFVEQEKTEQKQRAKAAASSAKERLKNERAALDALEKMWLEGIRNLQDKEYALTAQAGRKQIDDLKNRLKEEKNLSKTARAAINRQIILMEADLQLKLGDLRKKYQQDELEKQLNDTKNYYQHVLAGLKDESVDARVAVQLQINEIDTQLLKKSLKDGYEQVKQIAESAQKELDDLELGNVSVDDITAKYKDVWELNGINLGNALDNMRALVAKYQSDELTARTQYTNTVLAIDRETENEKQRIKAEGTKKIHDEELKQLDLSRKHAEILREIELAETYSPYEQIEMEKTRIMLEQAQERVKIAQDEYARLADERQRYTDEELKAMYGSVEEYNNVLIEAQLKVVESENAVKDAIKAVDDEAVKQKQTMISTATSIMSSMNSILGSFQGLFEQMAESDEKYADYATAMAMMQILVSTAISIANAIQGATAAGAATGVAAPFTTPAFIIEMVAIVAGAIASATTTLMKAKQQRQSAPKFAHGGLIGNKTTRRKDDTVDAKLTLGEYVIPAPVVDDIGVEFFDKILDADKNEKERIKNETFVSEKDSVSRHSTNDSSTSRTSTNDSLTSRTSTNDSSTSRTFITDEHTNTAVSETAVSNTAVSNTAVSKTAVNEAKASETKASETSVSKTAISELHSTKTDEKNFEKSSIDTSKLTEITKSTKSSESDTHSSEHQKNVDTKQTTNNVTISTTKNISNITDEVHNAVKSSESGKFSSETEKTTANERNISNIDTENISVESISAENIRMTDNIRDVDTEKKSETSRLSDYNIVSEHSETKAAETKADVFETTRRAESIKTADTLHSDTYSSRTSERNLLDSRTIDRIKDSESIRIIDKMIEHAYNEVFTSKTAAKENAKRYSGGGLVRGAGTGTSDSIHVMLSNGEYVIREKVVEEYGEDFFDRINFGLRKPVIDGIHFATGGLVSNLNIPSLNVDSSINYDLMREVMADAVSEIRPVVSVKEITKSQNRVKVKESVATL